MKFFYQFVKITSKAFFLLFYRLKVYGLEHFINGAAIIAPNHASNLDPPLIGATAPEEISFLAKKSLFDTPLLGFVIARLNAYPLTGTTQDFASFKLICSLLKKGQKVLIFPEGERTLNGKIGPMKSGIGMLTFRAMCPIIPVYVHGTYEIWPRGKSFPKLFGKTCCVVYGSPIHYEHFLSLPKKEAQEAIVQAVGDALNNLQKWYLDGAKGCPP